MSKPTGTKNMSPKKIAGRAGQRNRPLANQEAWMDAIKQRTAQIGIVGMGYVGLPLMRTFCAEGFFCLGFDIDQAKVDKLNAGKSYIKHIPSSLIKEVLAQGRFRASADPKSLRNCSYHAWDCPVVYQ